MPLTLSAGAGCSEAGSPQGRWPARGSCCGARADSPVALTLSVWGAQAEEEAFKSVIDKYQALHPNVTIRLEVNGNSMQLYQLVDTRLAGRQAPDIFRIQYQQVGRYASAHVLIDLTPYLDQG